MKKVSFILAVVLIAIASCTKPNNINYGSAGEQPGASYIPPTSPVPVDKDVMISLSYDMDRGEYIFTADQLMPTDVTFRGWTLYSAAPSYFTMFKGTSKIQYPFEKVDANNGLPADSYQIHRLEHWKPKTTDNKPQFTYGNITYHFFYETPANSAQEDE